MALYLYLAIAAIYLFYKWGTKYNNYFKDLGIPYMKPVFLLGSNSNMVTRKHAISNLLVQWYNEFYNEKVVGMFEGRKPMFLIKDPALVKQIAVKDFEYFLNHRKFIDENADPLFGKGLFALQDQKWKDMRSTLSPAFTGSKMRLMFDLLTECGQTSTKSLKEEIEKTGENSYEMRELLSKFTVDMIATCAFGLSVDSFKNPENDFQKIAQVSTNFTKPIMGFKLVAYQIIPKFMSFFKIQLFPSYVKDFFTETIIDTMRIREEQGIVRHDMINLLIQAKKGKLNLAKTADEKNDGFATVEESSVGKAKVGRVWDDMDLAAQAFIFFFAGFDATASTMSFAAHQIAINPEVQTKLQEEIRETQEMLEGKTLTYEILQKMKYLDQVVCETIRLYAPAPFLDRVCLKDYDLKYDDKVVKIKEGTMIWIPAAGFHNDPKYFPNPTKFDPDRFSEENKHNIDLDAYLPFGIGPRNCIGSRFALMEVKAVLYYMLLNFSFEVCKKTIIPMELQKISFGVRAEGGIWVGLKPRT